MTSKETLFTNVALSDGTVLQQLPGAYQGAWVPLDWNMVLKKAYRPLFIPPVKGGGGGGDSVGGPD